MSDLRRIIWVASFHKSGNTWTRAFLANYFAAEGAEVGINQLFDEVASDVRQHFFDKAAGRPFKGQSFDDSIRLRPSVQRLIAASKPNHQFVKTHSKIDRIGPVDLILPEVTSAAIYILRNPFDVAPSYARHSDVPIDRAIENMCDAKALTASETQIFEVLGRWDDHVTSWTGSQGLALHVMRYEDMAADPERAFRGLLGFLQAPVKDGQLRRAIRRSSFDSLQKQETKQGFRERPGAMERFFVRGRPGGWRDELTPAQVARIRAEFLPLLERWYPEMLSETETAARPA
jgi:hypothetical protein